MLEEEYNKWSKLKQKINKKKNIVYFREGQIWYINMWINIWYEEDWKKDNYSRPVLILKKFSKDTFLWISTTSISKKWKFYYNIWNIKWINNFLILSQIRLYSSKRLLSHIWWISIEESKNIKKKISKLIE